MSPSPALSKPPSQLSLLMNPLPDPPDPDDQMDIPEIFEGEPEMAQQGNSDKDLLHLVLQKTTGHERNHAKTKQTTGQLGKLQKATLIRGKHPIQNPNIEQITTSPIFCSYRSKRPNPETLPPTKQTPTSSTNVPTQEVNIFIKYNIVIRPRFGSPKPFKGKTTQEMYNKINKALIEINAKCENNPIRIKAITRYPSGDIKLFTKTRYEVIWLLNHRAEWTHLADPTFVTSPTLFSVMAHSCPTYLDLDDKTPVDTLLEQNEI
ncbi:hypothetical protein O181_019583 [Austropuccinia psidii MF-1]|uniref:Uncharacterized protein n=1 Tax=Austropuccinia psidii MF-1 TaxID=1389203 RepID=A0A9Q3C9X3_9BASI|nr:hypothetical protein [Austropuccinia psidii MF-1]